MSFGIFVLFSVVCSRGILRNYIEVEVVCVGCTSHSCVSRVVVGCRRLRLIVFFSVCLYGARRTLVLSVRCGLSCVAVVVGFFAICGIFR